MPADPTGPGRPDGQARFRADLATYLNSLPLHELGELLEELPKPTRVALMDQLSERGPAWARLPENWPQLPRRTRRSQLADRRAARRPLPPEVLQRWRAEPDRAVQELGRQRRSGAVAERRVAEALRAWAASPDPTDHRQREAPPSGQPPRSRDGPGQDRGHGRDQR